MSGFFTKSELIQSSKVKVDVNQLESDCLHCGLYKNCTNPKIKVSGEGKKKILIITEYPTESDAEFNTQLKGESGVFLKQKLRFNNVIMNRDCWKIHAVRCRPSNDKPPSASQIKQCYPSVLKTIKQLKPELILLMGDLSITSLYGEDFSNRKINRWRRNCIFDNELQCKVVPLYSPVHLVKNIKDKNIHSVFDRDLKYAISCLKIKFNSVINYTKYVTNLTSFNRVKKLLNRIIQRKPTIAYDYETTGLKPFRTGHKIVSIGIAVSPTKAFAFPYKYNNFWTVKEIKVIHKLWKQILADDEIKKVAHNSKYEWIWSKVMFNQDTKFHFDTMMCAHVLDNRSAYSGLKFQTFINYGVKPYDKEISSFLKAKKGEFNTVEKAPLKELLQYNGLDCIFTFMLYNDQIVKLTRNRNLLKAYNFIMAGNRQMGIIQLNGLSMNTNYYKQAEKDLDTKVKELKNKLESGREAKAFKKMFNKPIKITSNQDLGKLFYEVLGKPPIYTAKGQYKTDKTTLESLNLPYVKNLATMKRYEKAKGTYLGQFAREIFRSKMYPFFDLSIPVSYRSSSSRPNFQNLPKRDAEIKMIIRKGIIPKKGCILSEIDFSGAEVITSATYHKDPTFINYLIDPTTDMHRDCYDMQTKILTESGFKHYNEIQDNEKVGQYNPDTDKIEFVIPLDRIHHDYSGDMYYIKNKHFDTATTARHRMYLRKKDEEYSIIKSKDIKCTRYYSKVVADISDISTFYSHDFHFDKTHHHNEFTIKSDDMFELLGYLITDGHFKYHKQGAYRINLSQIKEPHKTKMKSCIDRIKSYTDFNFHEEKDKWSMSNKELCTWLCEKFGVNKINRKLPDFIKYAPTQQLKIFFDACMLGDGTWYKSGTSGKFNLISKQLIDEFQFICMRLGYSTSVYKYELKGNRTTQVYGVNIRQMKESLLIVRDQLTVKKYSGKVFCFTVPSGLLVTQRNSKISIQGNCASDLLILPQEMLENPKYTLHQKKLVKKIRFFAKNNWTFAQFYGDWFGSCAPLFWENVVEAELELPNRMTSREWLESKGIYELGEITKEGPTEGSFLEHCAHVEEKMWNERFPVYTQWKKDIVSQYREYGFIQNHFGFRFQGYMSDNQCTNFPIQSASFHLLLYTLVKVQSFIEKYKLKTRIIGQIHDSIVSNVPKEEIKFYHSGVNKIVKGLKDKFKWLIIPMEIEAEITKLREDGGNFSDLREVDPDNASLDVWKKAA